MKTAQKVISLPEFRMETIEFKVVGTAALLMHRFDEKTLIQISEGNGKVKLNKKEQYDPEEQFKRAMHYCEDGTPGFPAGGFKAALTRGAKNCNLVMTDYRTNVVVLPDCRAKNLVKIIGKAEIDQRAVRVNNKGVMRVRARFYPWSAVLQVRYNAGIFSGEQIAMSIRAAGMGGIGDFRPEKAASGDCGTFDLEGFI